MALLLHHHKTKLNTFTITNPSLLHRLFSTAGDKPPSNSPFSSYFKDIKETLKQPKTSTPPSSPPPPPPPPRNLKTTPSSDQEIQRNLSEFRRRTTAPPPPSADPISFLELYQRNISQKPDESSSSSPSRGYGNARPATAKITLDTIRESLRKMQASGGKDQMSQPAYKDMLKMRPDSASPPPKVIGGTSGLPQAIFGDKGKGDADSARDSAAAKRFVKLYRPEELGEKLRNLRPERKEKDRFSIKELSERLMRLREMDEKEYQSNIKGVGVSFTDLRECMVKMVEANNDKAKKISMQKMEIFNHIGGTPEYLLGPPKEHLVEKYFHPDNMSSAEKLKIELAKVRDEFKMSESDCGSARVQVAQLTTRIKHLSAVLHKKDVHSRKGLLAMVQLRKRLLKYLRRTDWDSYCFVISKLNLRDNPEHTYRGRSTQAA
ncbi:hypothetical protein RIF29_28581 [Crotalaria pallida]|uniref:Small ribosomal subunit protein uS15c n=1 Tax=Crotalaria pallida TaxID=3830 RepID=A0AAN9ECZ0_CROPI